MVGTLSADIVGCKRSMTMLAKGWRQELNTSITGGAEDLTAFLANSAMRRKAKIKEAF
jgi:hypothetical protein